MAAKGPSGRNVQDRRLLPLRGRRDEDFYKVYFRDVEIGEFDAEALRLRPVQAFT